MFCCDESTWLWFAQLNIKIDLLKPKLSNQSSQYVRGVHMNLQLELDNNWTLHVAQLVRGLHRNRRNAQELYVRFLPEGL